ncbi:MAG: diheme cytochrome c [Burkholderiaceae bacterium]|nr:diheme cytochrome c [Burkholderiaceae bacterium]
MIMNDTLNSGSPASSRALDRTAARRAGRRGLLGFAVCAAMACTGTGTAQADSRQGPAATLPAYAQECGACHLAYPPGLLPASSWQALLTGLAKHFGSDASLDAPATREIAGWLNAHAGSGKRAAERPPDDRITRAAWFTRKHREVSAATWNRPSIRNAGNCVACHGAAAAGDFDEHAVHIPK